MPVFSDLTGMKFNRLLVISRHGYSTDGHITWLCQCDCGNTTIVTGKNLKNGNTKSCGCYQKEQASKTATVFHKTHGLSKTRIYKIWKTMIQRCSNEKSGSFPNYGKRGIFVCDEWHDFINFYKWSMSNGYNENLTIDRIDTNGNYCPDNCRWTTRTIQQNNRRCNKRIIINGKSKTYAEWSRECGLSYDLIYSRIKKGCSGLDIIRPKGAKRNDYQD